MYSDRKQTNVIANDGKWHHICLAWRSRGGKVHLYFDKTSNTGDRFFVGKKIPGKHLWQWCLYLFVRPLLLPGRLLKFLFWEHDKNKTGSLLEYHLLENNRDFFLQTKTF